MFAAVLITGWTLAACSPTFNWREVRAEPTALKAMLPCKPDKGARSVPMAGREVSLQVIGCDTGGATFAVMFADLGDASRLGEVLAQWKAASLSNMRGTSALETPFRPPGALALPQSLQVVASGQRPDGTQVQSQAAYFAQGSHVFQAVIYTGQLKPEVAEPFFSGLKFQ
ncbi:hypothetical protein [Caenimonas soli]|uniref:hypothetical protein n=1 Tax=Caenimonas soli TaxID=2735555 RepID=UPI001553B03A|nr:hypothetical protein [Caenimonas soli]NPC59250.1 hypothetical protein [Caenimonas soli]